RHRRSVRARPGAGRSAHSARWPSPRLWLQAEGDGAAMSRRTADPRYVASGFVARDKDRDAIFVIELKRDDIGQQDRARIDGMVEDRAALDCFAQLDDAALQL